jgi:hypothetical protein
MAKPTASVRHTFGERVQKGNCYKTTYMRRSTEIPEQRIVADPDAQGFSGVGSGQDEAWLRHCLHALFVGPPLLRDVVVPRHEALAQLSYTSPQPREPGIRDPKELSRIVRRASG